jgi:phage tail sheath protein FI
MPAALTYPGVYVEEIPSGVRTITGVATSITAFIGRASRGPVHEATTINSYGDFETQFGGLWEKSSLGFAVRDFFLNGGSQAIIVRLFDPTPATPAPLTVGGTLTFVAAYPGQWGVYLRVTVDQNGVTDAIAQSLNPAYTKADVFNLTVVDSSTGQSEKYLTLTVKDSSRRVDKVLTANSSLLAYSGTPPAALPAIPAGQTLKDDLGTKEDVLAQAQTNLVNKQNDPSSSAADIANAKTARDTAKTALDNAVNAALAATTDGNYLSVTDFLPLSGNPPVDKTGMYVLEQADLFNILCIPPYHDPNDGKDVDVDVNLVSAAAAYCEQRRAMLIVDPPKKWTTKAEAIKEFNDPATDYIGTRSRNAALYFPRLQEANPLHDNQIETFAGCGTVAGIWARTDTDRGVWKAPAGLDASLVGVSSLAVQLTDAENGELNPLGINCLRSFPVYGRVVWGARTLRGADQLADEYKYVPVRRTALYIEESLYRGLKWVVFEPNDEPLWAQIRLNVGAFMHNLFRQGAFQGSTPSAAYFVKCDKETTTQNDIDLGIVNVVVGFAPLKPAEFVVIQLQQMAGQIQV